jgi:hypothetical protein
LEAGDEGMIFDLAKREEVKKTFPEQAKPSEFFPYYLVYSYEFAGPYLLGLDSMEVVDRLSKLMEKKTTFCCLQEEFPYEILLEWKKKEKKK